MDALKSLRVVLVHDWLTGMRGGEKVLEAFCRLFPDAPLYTVLHHTGSVSPLIENRVIHTSYLQRLPGVHRYYRYLLPLMPGAVRWTLPDCDLVLSDSSSVAKAVQAPTGVPHVCYCHSPMRYAWHMRDSYGWRGLKGWLIDRLLTRIRTWDRATARHVDHFLANSHEIQNRIAECYSRSSTVVYPPVDTEFYCSESTKRGDEYLIVSAFAPYKRLELAIDACNRMQRKLVIIGKGQEEARLRARAGSTVRFLGWQSDDVIRAHFRRARALLFPGREDFGIVPVEAQACGCPVIAFAEGGATETVLPLGQSATPTGVWFHEQSTESVMDAMKRLEGNHEAFSLHEMRRHAEQFNAGRFEREIASFLCEVLGRRQHSQAA